MLERALRWLTRMTVTHPVTVLALVGLVSIVFAESVGRLQMRSDLIDLVASGTDASRLQRDAIRKLGYGNQFFVILEASPGDSDAEAMEAVADRLSESMRESGYFKDVRSGMSESEMLDIVRLYAWNFPAFADAAARDRIAERLSAAGVREHVRTAVSGLVTPFGSMASSYFTVDPLGLAEFLAADAKAGLPTTFDLNWGSGGRFFSRDHRALLLIASPRMPASDYEFSVALVGWMRKCIAVLTSDPLAAQHKLRIVPVGAQVYTEQNRRLIQSNIRTASAISVLGNLALLLLVYRWMPAIVLTVLPTSLALLWTTGFVALYPGVVNLVSMSFIAILAGLGDDQVTYFFSRVPEERARGLNVEQAVAKTYLTTGKSVLFCVLTTSTGTLALALSRFQPLAELGLILTVGLLMLAVHTLVTVPAVMAVWEKFRGYRVTGPPFRGLPAAAGRLGTLVSRRPVPILVLSFALLAASVVGLPRIRISQGVDVFDGGDALGITGQRMLSDRFGLEGAPTVFLLEGSLSSVLSRAERIDHRLRELVASGAIRSIATPSSLVPTASSQHVRRDALAGLDFAGAARLLTAVLAENDLAPAAFEPAIQRMRAWPGPELGLEEVQRHLPSGLLDNTIVEVEPGRYLAAVTTYSSNPEATAALPSSIVDALAREAGPLVEFSYDRVGRELRDRLVVDSRVALSGTVLGVLAIVFLGFRRMKPSLLVLLPIVYGVVVTFGTMALLGHRFSAMAFFAVPLIIGIGIDNGIHLIRRYLEGDGGDVRRVVAASGPAVIQTNLTTIVGFGALMSSSFKPLAELGLITALGVGWTLLASLVVVPALIARSASRAAPPDASLLEESGRQAGA